MLIDLPWPVVAVLNVAGWPIIQIGLAWCFTRMPASWFAPPQAGAWEDGGRFYEQSFSVRRWKDRLPDGAAWFDGGFAKQRLAAHGSDHLSAFRRETWRGELCHWAAIACTPVFFLWNPLWADAVMVVYALAANLPCIIVQRFNRARLNRCHRNSGCSSRKAGI